ncbi:MAG: DUF2807 domain-containing protein, partial [Bacteroidota bacterium]|nr:DUF2807 domain-containing protein [Bacteroidota bacterium]
RGTLNLGAPKINADISGASHIELQGESKDVTIESSGASHANCMELMAENVQVDVSGASNAEVYASIKLDAEASGAGNVRYKGNAAVSQRTSGAGSVSKVN